jgi:hypothetical protein
MTILPKVKRSDVMAAPIRTSLHKMLVSGINLKISANRTAITPKEKTKWIDSKRIVEIRTKLLTNPAAADKTAVTTNDVSNRNPVATTRPSEKNRCLPVILQKLLVPRSTFQIVLSASWSSLKAPDAPTNIASRPRAVANAPAQAC